MGRKAERFTRFDEALYEAAAVEGSRQSRSTRQQLEQWARLGAALSAQMQAPGNRVRLGGLESTIPQRDITRDEARQLDAVTTVRIDDAVERADFTDAPLPDFTTVSPDPHRVLGDLAARAQISAHARDRLRDALAHLDNALNDQQPPKTGR
ncbi:ParD-like antitoxin of type II toxin-antitoxin system [Nocardioides scoriae]|uniref:ParD-like antitoxin of type II toxin-antitoxin system n=1 Tax=Nocardioides scoriae TaxID=642780 RepID=A0A1H1VGF8_9ACTN|nr:hypothetical protein [Nocardioides scoriae]SDS83765.1 ParD-like antitoxin of type II toxin-antitoxin system [Nocardioides scoriae]